MPGALYMSHFINSNCIDVIGLYEHWLFPHSLSLLDSIDNWIGNAFHDVRPTYNGMER